MHSERYSASNGLSRGADNNTPHSPRGNKKLCIPHTQLFQMRITIGFISLEQHEKKTYNKPVVLPLAIVYVGAHICRSGSVASTSRLPLLFPDAIINDALDKNNHNFHNAQFRLAICF